MADFPTIATSSTNQYSQEYFKPQVRTEFENGTVQSRARATKARWKFTIGWNALSNTDYTTLQTFFNNNIGGTFNWTHPITSTVHVVRFSNDTLPAARPDGFINGIRAWQLSGLQLEEA